MTKVAFIDDNKTYLSLLEQSVKMEPDIRVLLTATSIESFFDDLPSRATLDIVFVDINLPGISGIEAIPKLRSRLKHADFVMLSEVRDGDMFLKALSTGATGYLVKGFSLVTLPSFIQTIKNGGAVISPIMARRLVNYFNPPSSDLLSAREIKILQSLADGQTYKSVADMLNVTVDGVKYHIKNIYKKLNVNNKIDAINYLNQHRKS